MAGFIKSPAISEKTGNEAQVGRIGKPEDPTFKDYTVTNPPLLDELDGPKPNHGRHKRKRLTEDAPLPLVLDAAVRAPKRLTNDQWLTIYANPAFPDEWGDFFHTTHQELLEHYAPDEDTGGPQYRVMCWRLAVLTTIAAQMDVTDGSEGRVKTDERMAVDREIRQFVAQLQKYTETEKHIVEVTTAAQEQLAHTFATVIDYVIQDAALRSKLFDALTTAVQKGDVKLLEAGDEDADEGEFREVEEGE